MCVWLTNSPLPAAAEAPPPQAVVYGVTVEVEVAMMMMMMMMMMLMMMMMKIKMTLPFPSFALQQHQPVSERGASNQEQRQRCVRVDARQLALAVSQIRMPVSQRRRFLGWRVSYLPLQE